MEDIKNFVRWSKEALPGGDAIKNLPIISLCEFIDAINGGDHAPYREDVAGKKYNPGIFNTHDTLFLDIDHIDDYFDIIWSNMEQIIQDCPFIALVKQSRSKSLHFICVGHWETLEEHIERDMFYLACVAKSILNHTGIDLREEDKALDVHTKSCDQRLFVYDPKRHPYIINQFPTPVTMDGSEKAFDEYPMLRPVKEKTPTAVLESFDGSFDAKSRNEDERILLNRDCTICGFTGNDARWRIANAVAYLTNGDIEQARMIIRGNFKNPGDFSFASIAKGVNMRILEWVKSNLQNTYGGECEGYITDKIDEIIHYIKLHPRTLLVAPTGSGKTTLVNGSDGFEGLAKRLNAVVVCPFNNMLHLYSNMTAIKSDAINGVNIKDYRSDEPCVIIWDQVVKMIDRIVEDDRLVIVDESHTLFLDREYRDSAVALMNALKRVRRVLCITATPTGEEAELGLERISYNRKKNIIDTTMIYTESNAGVKMKGDIKWVLKNGRYDRVVVFSDKYARRLHENLNSEAVKHAFIHSKNRTGEDFKTLQETEMLTEKVTICTSLAFNGLNFKNTGERILVVMDIKEGDMLASHIIQCAGRLRRSNVSLNLYMIPKGERSTVDQRKLKSDLAVQNGMDNMLVSADPRLISDDNYKAYKSIEDYTNIHSTFDAIKKELQEAGYFVIRTLQDNGEAIKAQIRLDEKRAIEQAWSEGFVAGHRSVEAEITNNEYYRNCESLWRKLVWDFSMRADVVRDILKNKKGDKLASTILEDLYFKCRVNSYSNDEFERMTKEVEGWIKQYSNELGPVVTKQLKKDLSRMRKWREHYGEDNVNGDMMRMCEVLRCDLFDEMEQRHENASKAHSVKHKPHKKKLYRCEDSFEGTIEEVAKHTGKGVSTIKRYISNGTIVKV